MTSVLQAWVMELPLRAQGTLLTGVRGCDLAPKSMEYGVEGRGCSTGESSPERHLVAFLRYCFMVPADPREVDVPGAFFQSKPPCDWKPSMFGHYPQHWYSHVMHCFEVIAFEHPDANVAIMARYIYERLVYNMHLNGETQKQYDERMNEDRIANGTVVS